MKWCDCAFDVPTWVLRHVMNGQVWPEGGTEYHEWITSPTLIIHGQHDQLISLEEEKHMQAVKLSIVYICYIMLYCSFVNFSSNVEVSKFSCSNLRYFLYLSLHYRPIATPV